MENVSHNTSWGVHDYNEEEDRMESGAEQHHFEQGESRNASSGRDQRLVDAKRRREEVEVAQDVQVDLGLLRDRKVGTRRVLVLRAAKVARSRVEAAVEGRVARARHRRGRRRRPIRSA